MLPEPCEALAKGLPIVAMGAIIDNIVVGTIAGAADADVFEILSLYVDPEYRRQGAARALIDAITEYTDEMGLGLKAEYTVQNDDNKTLTNFFEAMSFMEDPVEYPMYCLGHLGNLTVNVGASRIRYDGITSFFDTPKRLLSDASGRSSMAGWPLPKGGLTTESIDREMSFCSIAGNRIRAYIVVEPFKEGMIRIPALWSQLNDPRELMVMMSRSIEKMKKGYDARTRVAMLAMNEISYKIIEHVCGEVELCSFRFIR